MTFSRLFWAECLQFFLNTEWQVPPSFYCNAVEKNNGDQQQKSFSTSKRMNKKSQRCFFIVLVIFQLFLASICTTPVPAIPERRPSPSKLKERHNLLVFFNEFYNDFPLFLCFASDCRYFSTEFYYDNYWKNTVFLPNAHTG